MILLTNKFRLAKEYLFQIILSPRVQNSIVYLSASVLGSGVAIFLVPILTRYLTPQDYGIVANYTALLTIISFFIALSNSGYIFRNFFFLKKEQLSKSISSVFLINISIAIIVLFILVFCSKLLYSELQIPCEWLIIIPFLSLAQMLIDTTLGFYQAQNEAKKYSMIQLTQTVLNLGLSIYFVVVLLWNWQGRLISQIISTGIIATIGYIIITRKHSIKLSYKEVNKSYIKDFLKFGIPLIPHSIGGFVLSLSDRFFLSSMVGVAATGLYNVGATFGGLMMILHGAFYRVFLPYAFEKLSSSNDSIEVKRKLVKITYLYIFAFITFSLLLYLFAILFFPWFVGPKFENAYVYVLWIALGYAMLAAYQMFTIYVIYTKKTRMVGFRTDFLAAAVKIPLTYFLILYIGPIGAAVATFAAYFITALSSWHINNKAFPMPWFDFYKPKTENI